MQPNCFFKISNKFFQNLPKNSLTSIQNYSTFFNISYNLKLVFWNFQQIFPKSSEEFHTISSKLIQCQRDSCQSCVWASLLKCLLSVSTHGCHKKLPMTTLATKCVRQMCEAMPHTFGVAPLTAVVATCVSHVNICICAYLHKVRFHDTCSCHQCFRVKGR